MKKTAKIVCAVMAFVMCAAMFVSCSGSNNTIVVGLSGPLSGPAAIYGNAVKNGAQMAIDEINEAGGLNGVKLSLVMIDDKHDATQVSTAYAALVEKGMQVSLGTVTTAPGLEFKTLSKDDNVFFLTPSASGDAIPEFANGYQMCFADGNQGQVSAQYVNANYAGQTIGVFYKSDDAYSKGIFDNFKAALNANVTTVDTSFTDATATDFSTQIDTLKNCTFIFMPIYYTPASLFMEQAKNTIAANAVYFGCDGFDGIDSMEGFDVTSIPQEVSMLSHFNSKATDGLAGTFITKYVATYGKDTLNQFGASAYDCVWAIYNAMKELVNEGKTVDANTAASDLCDMLKAKFNGGFTFTGVTGENITWQSTGYVQKGAVKYQVKAATSAQ